MPLRTVSPRRGRSPLEHDLLEVSCREHAPRAPRDATAVPGAATSLIDLNRAAVFLNVDGALLEPAHTPDAVRVAPATIVLLSRLLACTGGAMALVSGRRIARLDELFTPLRLPATGLHGLERRSFVGVYRRAALPAAGILARARRLLENVCRAHPELLLEDKQFALALHFRRNPALATEVERSVMAIARALDPHLVVERGRLVMEVRPAGPSKALAIAEFMDERPFAGRLPVMIGDGLTDESALQWISAHGGVSLVNSNSEGRSRHRFPAPDVRAVHDWLSACVRQDELRAGVRDPFWSVR